MKISYNDMFTNISDVAYEILEENDMLMMKPMICFLQIELVKM